MDPTTRAAENYEEIPAAALALISGRVEITDACWLWTGAMHPAGYGRIRIGGRRGRQQYAHRWLYGQVVGPVPLRLDLDHLCRVRRCVRPSHLEVVTRLTNIQRGEGGYGLRKKCRAGLHDITDVANVYTNPQGERQCRPCKTASTIKSNRRGRPRDE